MTSAQIFQLVLVIATSVALVYILQFRRRQARKFRQEFAHREVCEHLRPVLELLESRGHAIVRVGQKSPEMPLEIHLWPAFDPKKIAEEMNLKEPVFVSDRNVLFCYDDECELHPADSTQNKEASII